MGTKVRTYFHERTKSGNLKKDSEGNLIPLDSNRPAKQTYKDQCDINRVLHKAQHTGTVSHVAKYGQIYADFADFDYEEAQNRLAEAQSLFFDLPSEIRREFGNRPKAFLDFVANNPLDVVEERLPQLAEMGRQFPDVVGGRIPPAEAAQAAVQEVANATVSEPAEPAESTVT